MAAVAFGVQGLPGVGCGRGGLHPHVLHILWQCAQAQGIGEAERLPAVGGREGGSNAGLPAPWETPSWRPSSLPCSVEDPGPPSSPSPCDFGCGSLGTDGTGPLEGRVTHRTEAANTAPHPHTETQRAPRVPGLLLLGTWAASQQLHTETGLTHRLDCSSLGIPKGWSPWQGFG